MNDINIHEVLINQMQVRLGAMSVKAIENEEKLLSGLGLITNNENWPAVEHYARHMADTYTRLLLDTPARDEGSIGGLQAAVKVWRDIIGLKKMAARQSVLCRDRLAALRKEDADGHQRDEG